MERRIGRGEENGMRLRDRVLAYHIAKAYMIGQMDVKKAMALSNPHPLPNPNPNPSPHPHPHPNPNPNPHPHPNPNPNPTPHPNPNQVADRDGRHHDHAAALRGLAHEAR